MGDMPKRVEVGQEWFVVSMKWIKKWQQFVGFESTTAGGDDEEGGAAAPEYGPKPGKIDNSDIILDDG